MCTTLMHLCTDCQETRIISGSTLVPRTHLGLSYTAVNLIDRRNTVWTTKLGFRYLRISLIDMTAIMGFFSLHFAGVLYYFSTE